MHSRCFDFDEKVGIWLHTFGVSSKHTFGVSSKHSSKHTFGVGSNGAVELGDIFLAMQE
jgi:hypothetical protein